MARSHGRKTVIIINEADISQYCTNSELEQTSDTHDNTTYRPPGKVSKIYDGGLLDGTLSLEGRYDTTAGTGPRAVLKPLIGQTITWTRRPEGTGEGLPQDTGEGVLNSYTETNPVADYITWAAEIQLSDDVDSDPQAGGGS